MSYGQGLRCRGRPGGRDPKGGGYRTTSRVKVLARCKGIAPRAFPCLSCDIRRDAPVHGEKAGLVAPLDDEVGDLAQAVGALGELLELPFCF